MIRHPHRYRRPRPHRRGSTPTVPALNDRGRRVRVIRDGTSRQGRRVRLGFETGLYKGAQLYLRVDYFAANGVTPKVTRCVPTLELAEWLYQQFLLDITNPRALRYPGPRRRPRRVLTKKTGSARARR